MSFIECITSGSIFERGVWRIEGGIALRDIQQQQPFHSERLIEKAWLCYQLRRVRYSTKGLDHREEMEKEK